MVAHTDPEPMSIGLNTSCEHGIFENDWYTILLIYIWGWGGEINLLAAEVHFLTNK